MSPRLHKKSRPQAPPPLAPTQPTQNSPKEVSLKVSRTNAMPSKTTQTLHPIAPHNTGYPSTIILARKTHKRAKHHANAHVPSVFNPIQTTRKKRCPKATKTTIALYPHIHPQGRKSASTHSSNRSPLNNTPSHQLQLPALRRPPALQDPPLTPTPIIFPYIRHAIRRTPLTTMSCLPSATTRRHRARCRNRRDERLAAGRVAVHWCSRRVHRGRG